MTRESFLKNYPDSDEIQKSKIIFHPVKQTDDNDKYQNTLLQYKFRKIPRYLPYAISCSSLSNKHSCGLFNYTWLLCNCKTYTAEENHKDKFRAYLIKPVEIIKRAFSVRTNQDCLSALDHLQRINLIKFIYDPKTHIVTIFLRGYLRKKASGVKTMKFEKSAIKKHIGFVFINFYEINAAFSLSKKYSERDALIFLWLHTVFDDPKFTVSKNTACVVLRDKYNYSQKLNSKKVATLWGCTTATASSMLLHMQRTGFISIEKIHSTGTFIFINHYSEWLWNRASLKITSEDILVKILNKDPDLKIRAQKQKINTLLFIARYYRKVNIPYLANRYTGKSYVEKLRLINMLHLSNITEQHGSFSEWIDSVLEFYYKSNVKKTAPP